MSSQLVDIFVLSLLAMANPSLLAAVTVMLLLPHPKRLLTGYLVGAYVVSIGVGLLIVFALPGSHTESTSKRRADPIADIVLATLVLAVAYWLGTGRDQAFAERRRAKKEAKLKAEQAAGKPTQPWPMRLLSEGNPWVAFLVGAALSFPGVSYLDALDHVHRLKPGTAQIVLLVVYFTVAQLLLLELPLLGYLFAPEWTDRTITRFKNWVAREGRNVAVVVLCVVGVWLLARGLITLL